jgi:hypothetical protein
MLWSNPDYGLTLSELKGGKFSGVDMSTLRIIPWKFVLYPIHRLVMVA